METSIKSIVLFSAVILTGLSAGLFYAWAVSVIPGTKSVSDQVYLEAMQSINRAILNPAFYLIFFGSLILLTISTIQHAPTGLTFWLLLAASITYLIGTMGVTILGNVPLNDALDALDLSELSTDLMTSAREAYELKWNQLHMIRTIFSVISFLAALLGAWSKINI